MTMVRHELRMSRRALIIWSAAIAFFILVCVLMFPEMKEQMQGVSALFASMGMFTKAFGMDKLNFGTLTGFYSIECGNILGMGGAFFAAMIAAGVLSKEEKEHTAEFLFTHPVSRTQVLSSKLISLFIQLVILNAAALGTAVVSILIISEPVPWKELALLHGSCFLVQTELAGICFGVSAFIRSNGMGAGLGLAILFYFMNLIANISSNLSVFKYISPFGFADAADLIGRGGLDPVKVGIGLLITICGIAAGYMYYNSKDLR